jgi:hypothetical protein
MVDFTFELLRGTLAGGGQSVVRHVGSRDSNHWLTLSRGNVTRVDFTFELIYGELAAGPRLVGRHSGS